MPLAEVCNCKKSNRLDKYTLLQQIQSTLGNGLERKIFVKNYRQWFLKIISFKSIAFIVFNSVKNRHTIYDIFPENFRPEIKRQLEDGIINWAGQNKQIFISDPNSAHNEKSQNKKIFVPMHCFGNYIGIIEIVPKKKLNVLNNEMKILLSLVGNLIADYFDKFQGRQEEKIIGNLPDDELFHLALLGAISNGVIHEISNPLTTVVGRTGLLLNNQDRLQSNLEIIEREAARVSGTIHEFLALSRKHYRKEIDRDIQLNEIIEKAISLLGYYAKSKQIKISLHLEPTISRVSVNYFSFLSFLTQLIFAKLIQVEKLQTLQISTHQKDENLFIEINSNLHDNSIATRLSAEYSVSEKNGKTLIQLPVFLETCQNIN